MVCESSRPRSSRLQALCPKRLGHSGSRRYHRAMNKLRLLIIAFILLCIFGTGLFIGRVIPRFAQTTTAPQIQSTATILREVQTLSQLVTVKYVLERVVILEDMKWYGDNRVALVAHGVVKAGIDFSQLKPDQIHIENKSIRLKLPSPILTDAYLDEKQTQVLERSTGLMRAFDKDLEQNARRQALGELARAARQTGILADADERAISQLTNLFHQLGFTAIKIESSLAKK